MYSLMSMVIGDLVIFRKIKVSKQIWDPFVLFSQASVAVELLAFTSIFIRKKQSCFNVLKTTLGKTNFSACAAT